MNPDILYIPIKSDSERESVATAWESSGGVVKRLDKFWIKPNSEDANFSIYGNDTLSLVLAQIINATLVSPRDELIAELDNQWIKRDIELISIEAISKIQFPRFCKPVTPKLFQSQIYDSRESLMESLIDLKKEELIIISSIVDIEAEVRSFVLNSTICDLAIYDGQADIDEAKNFIQDFIQSSNSELPNSYVLDAGYNSKLGWFIIEFNAAWGAGLNSCNPKKVIACIREATKH
ncbi:MAG: ATP-grasp domain-containing protein [Bacteroidota bacterium]